MILRPNDAQDFTVAGLGTTSAPTAANFSGSGVVVATAAVSFYGARFSRWGSSVGRFVPLGYARRWFQEKGTIWLAQSGAAGGAFTLEFYECGRSEAGEVMLRLGQQLGPSPSTATVNPKAAPTASHSIGKIASVVAGAQITDATYLLAGGASQDVVVEVTGDGLNPKGVFLSDVSQADAAAFTCPPVYGAGIDYWSVPAGGKIWQAAADTAQTIYVKVVHS